MVNKNFWDLLREKQGTLTKSGTIIADYLTRHAEEAQFLSISSLAKECNMAEATISPQREQLFSRPIPKMPVMATSSSDQQVGSSQG